MAALTTAALHAGGAGLAAQDLVQPDTTVPAGSVVGSVVAAQSGAPLDGAVVLLEPAPGGALSSAAPASHCGHRDPARHERGQERGGEDHGQVRRLRIADFGLRIGGGLEGRS
ncbi:MAG TPA: hypothetical protein VEK78_08140, partial [Gemmatimonadales bacterium]|nr:hypothetical protein [Gemmatimonadales bacterium]